MRLIRGLNLRSFPFSSSFKFWFLSYILLLLLTVSSVSAQTSTPTGGFSTAVPGSTPTPGGGNPLSQVTFNFLDGRAGFQSLFGEWVVFLGWHSENEIMDLRGGYSMQDVSQLVLHYSSDADFEAELQLCTLDCLGDDTIEYFLLGIELEACPTGCEYVYSPGSVDIGKIKMGFQSMTLGEPYDGVFTVTAIDVVFAAAVGEYDLNGDCPVLSELAVSLLEPAYFASCRRCFLEATPVRDSVIPIAQIPTATLNGTLQSTFEIPIMISGTPVTRTPAAPGGGLFTATPTVTLTNTPGGATATPHFEQVIFDFTDGGQHSWIPMNYPATWGDQIVTFQAGGIQSVFTASPSAREYIQIDRLAASGSITGVTAIGFQYSTLGDNGGGIIWEVYDTNGASLTSLIAGSTVGGTGTSLNQTYILGSPVTLSGWGVNAYTGVLGGTNHWYLEKILLTTTNVVTATPALTSTPNPTGAPWVVTPVMEENDCSVAVFRDATPIAEFPTYFTVVDYGCYTIVPEVEITFSQPDVIVDGLSVCVTWFQMPLISMFGVVATLDWLLLLLAAYMVKLITSI